MLIWTDKQNSLIYIKIDLDSIDNIILNILEKKGWEFCSSTITCTKKYDSNSELIGILKEIDVPSDGIEEILQETSNKQT